MLQAKNAFLHLNHIQRKIALVLLAVAVLMILFPPKAIVGPSIMGMTQSEHYGYVFLFSDPTAQLRNTGGFTDFLGQLVHSQIEWGRLLLQLVVLSAVGFFAIKSQEVGNPFSVASRET